MEEYNETHSHLSLPPPIIPFPIESLKPFLNKKSVDIEKPNMVQNIMSIYETGCGIISSEIFNLLIYIKYLNETTDHPYRHIDPRLMPYLPYFVFKDSSNLLSFYDQKLITNNSKYASTFNDSTTVTDVQFLLEFSKFNPIYGSLFSSDDYASAHHFTIYNGKICTSWGETFYVFYVEKEISAEDLKFLVQYKGTAHYKTNEGIINRYRNLMSKYFFDIDNFFYFSLKDMLLYKVYCNGFDLSHIDAVETCILLTGWLYSPEDNRKANDTAMEEPYKIIKDLVLNNKDLLVRFFQPYDIEFRINPKDSDATIRRNLKDTLEDFEMVFSDLEEDEDAVEGYKRKRVLTELIQLCGITNRTEIEKVIDYYYEELTYYGSLTLYEIIKNRQLVDQRKEALMLYHRIKLENLPENHDLNRRLNNNAFYKAYITEVTRSSNTFLVGLTFISNRSIQNLSSEALHYHRDVYDNISEPILSHLKMIHINDIHNPYSSVDVYTNYYFNMVTAIRNQFANTFQYHYIYLMEKYGGNVEEIIRRLNYSYELLRLTIDGENDPKLMEIKDPKKCILEKTKMKTRAQTRREEEPFLSSIVPYAHLPSISNITIPISEKRVTRSMTRAKTKTKPPRSIKSIKFTKKTTIPISLRIKTPTIATIRTPLKTTVKKYRIKNPKKTKFKKGGKRNTTHSTKKKNRTRKTKRHP